MSTTMDDARGGLPRASSRFGWLREPLVHFVALGAVLFGADHVISGREDDPRRIVVGPGVDAEAREVFEATRGRAPDAAELEALRRVWLDNEVLYREGLALGVDRGDSAIRERVIFKALSMIDANVKVPAPDETTLRAYFDRHRAKYDEPTRYDFHEAALTGESSEAAVRAFVSDLNSGRVGEAPAGLRIFKGRPQVNLDQSYGPAFAPALAEATPGQWQAYPTRYGWRAIRLDAIQPGAPAEFERLRGVVLQDWSDTTAAEQRTDAVRALARRYRVEYAGAAPGAAR